MMDMTNFVKERDSAFANFVETDDLDAVKSYCRKYGVAIPDNERVFKASIYKAVQECRGIPEDVKILAAMKCMAIGFKPFMGGAE